MLLSKSICEKVLNAGLSTGADFAELYIEKTYENNMQLSSQKITQALVGKKSGAGVRLFFGSETIYGYTNDLSEAGLIKTALKCASSQSLGEANVTKNLVDTIYKSIHKFDLKPWELDAKKKASYLSELDRLGRTYNSEITQVIGNLIEVHKEVQVCNSLGQNSYEKRQYSNIAVQTYAERNGQKEYGYERAGKLASSDFFKSIDLQALVQKAAQLSIDNLSADFAPAKEMPVIIDSGFGGVIFHEACGHGLETTSVAKNASVFCEKLNQKIANDCVTAIDDGTIQNEYGSLTMDDEGYPTQKTVLIENGILKSYIVDQMGAKKTGYKPTGSGRRQDYTFAPTSRMRNTYIAAGTSNLEEMIADVDYGLFAKKMGGGSVTPATGAYNFSVLEAFLIEKGKISKRVKGASLIGSGIETLGRISKVGTDMKLSAGTCGSISGMIPTTVGQPPILVSKLTVGGRA